MQYFSKSVSIHSRGRIKVFSEIRLNWRWCSANHFSYKWNTLPGNLVFFYLFDFLLIWTFLHSTFCPFDFLAIDHLFFDILSFDFTAFHRGSEVFQAGFRSFSGKFTEMPREFQTPQWFQEVSEEFQRTAQWGLSKSLRKC